MMRTQQTLIIGFLAAALAAGSAWAAGTSSSNGNSTTANSKNNKVDPKDPVAMAFRLPGGTTLTAKQTKAYDRLKTKYESTLRDALDLLHSKDKADQSKGLKLNRETRAQIKAGIKDIIDTGYADAQKAAMAAAAAYEAAHPRPTCGACPCGR